MIISARFSIDELKLDSFKPRFFTLVVGLLLFCGAPHYVYAATLVDLAGAKRPADGISIGALQAAGPDSTADRKASIPATPKVKCIKNCEKIK